MKYLQLTSVTGKRIAVVPELICLIHTDTDGGDGAIVSMVGNHWHHVKESYDQILAMLVDPT